MEVVSWKDRAMILEGTSAFSVVTTEKCLLYSLTSVFPCLAFQQDLHKAVTWLSNEEWSTFTSTRGGLPLRPSVKHFLSFLHYFWNGIGVVEIMMSEGINANRDEKTICWHSSWAFLPCISTMPFKIATWFSIGAGRHLHHRTANETFDGSPSHPSPHP